MNDHPPTDFIKLLLDEMRLLRKEIAALRDDVNEDIVEIKEAVAALKAREPQQDIQNLGERVRKLEQGKSRTQGVAAGLGLASGGGISAIIQWLLHGS